jgi:hypothetical protein
MNVTRLVLTNCGADFHHWTAGIAMATGIAHKGEVIGAKVLTGSVIDLMRKPELLIEAKECFNGELAREGIDYAPLLATKTLPPADLNFAEMETYRQRLKTSILNMAGAYRAPQIKLAVAERITIRALYG